MDSAAIADRGQDSQERLLLRDGGRTLCVLIDEIGWVGAAGNYVEIHTARKTHLVRHTVKAMVEKLDSARFIRIRPSAIVKVSEVAALESRSGGDYVVRLRDGTEIRSSRSYRESLEQVFGRPGGRRHRRASGPPPAAGLPGRRPPSHDPSPLAATDS